MKTGSETRAVLLIGGGGQARVAADVIRAAGGRVIGACDLDASKLDEVIEPGGARVVVTQSELFEDLDAVMARLGATEALVTIGHNGARGKVSTMLGEWLCAPWIDPRAIISESATLGAGTVVLPGAIVNAAARVGRAVILNTRCVIEHDCVIEDAVHVSPGATLCGGVTVKEGAWVGAGATVIPLVTVGAGAIVGAGAAVVRDIPAGVTAVGVPAKPRG